VGGVDGSFQQDSVALAGSSSMGSVHKMGAGGPPTASRKNEALSADDLNKRFRVKPCHFFPSPTFMNETELYQCMMAPSAHFEFLTSYLNSYTKGASHPNFQT
jgi:hypothetical protein